MKNRMFTPLNRQRLLWAAVCGLLAVVAVLLFVAWRGSLAVPPRIPCWSAGPCWTPWPGLSRRCWPWSWHWPLASGPRLAWRCRHGGAGHRGGGRTAAHLLCSSALFAGVCWICGLPPANWQELLLLLGIYWLMYLVVWLLRYLRWRAELDAIRRALGLARRPPEVSGRRGH